MDLWGPEPWYTGGDPTKCFLLKGLLVKYGILFIYHLCEFATINDKRTTRKKWQH